MRRTTVRRSEPPTSSDAELGRLSKQKVGGFREGETPGPIPNPAVKPLSADGTAARRGRVGRRRPLLPKSPSGSSPAGLFALQGAGTAGAAPRL